MLEDAIRKIEEAIKKVGSLKSGRKAELLRLLGELKKEVRNLPKAHGERAQSIGNLAHAAAHEAARKKRAPALLKHSTEGLSLSAEEFSVSHPKIVEIVNDIALMLSQIGI